MLGEEIAHDDGEALEMLGVLRPGACRDVEEERLLGPEPSLQLSVLLLSDWNVRQRPHHDQVSGRPAGAPCVPPHSATQVQTTEVV